MSKFLRISANQNSKPSSNPHSLHRLTSSCKRCVSSASRLTSRPKSTKTSTVKFSQRSSSTSKRFSSSNRRSNSRKSKLRCKSSSKSKEKTPRRKWWHQSSSSGTSTSTSLSSLLTRYLKESKDFSRRKASTQCSSTRPVSSLLSISLSNESYLGTRRKCSEPGVSSKKR